MAQDYYALLGVTRSATEEEIKRAYRQRARELHPDANGGDPATEERFKEATLAYETLRDAERRRRYDMFGPEGLRGTGGPFGPGGAGGAGGPGGANDLFGAGLGDLLGAFFGGGAGPFGAGGPGGGAGSGAGGGPGRPRAAQGAHMEVTVELGFEEAVFGVAREVSLRLPVECSTCSGSGAAPGTKPTVCAACNGLGELRRVRQSILGQMVTASPCNRCRGTGQVIASACPACRGEGRRTEERAVTVEVPAGVDEGSTLRLNGRGASGSRGGPPGDLYVHLKVRPHPRFRRDGYDLVELRHIPMTQAALGVIMALETLDGDEDLVVPAGTHSGRTFRLRGRGVPHVQARGRGDLVVEVVVDTPGELSGEQAELLRQLAELRGEEVAPGDAGLMRKIRSAFR
ncbi:MAG: molecular chaperone DnaJ [Acidimicrobiales bacterium]